MRAHGPRFEDEDDDDDPDTVVAVTSPLPSVAPPARNWEYRVDALSLPEASDAAGFTARLNQLAEEGWDLVQVTDGVESKLLLLRRPRQSQRELRRVGFAPHPQS